MTSRLLPYATSARLLAQLFSDVVVAAWTFLWVLIALAVHGAVATIAGVGRQFERGAQRGGREPGLGGPQCGSGFRWWVTQ